MNKLKIAVTSLITGTAITGLTGFLDNSALIGASWYGYPTTWIRKLVLAPQYNPWRIAWGGLVVDIIFWFVIVLVVWLAVGYLIGGGSKPKPAASAKKKSKK